MNKTRYALSPTQLTVWVDGELHPGVYNMCQYVEILGRLDLAIMRAAVGHVVANTAIHFLQYEQKDDQVRQWFDFELAWDLEVVDFSKSDNPQASAEEWVKIRRRKDFVFQGAPLFRYTIIKLEESRFYWVLNLHHLIADGFGLALIIRNVSEAYKILARREPLANKPDFDTYIKYLEREHQYGDTEQGKADRDYWINALSQVGPSPTLNGRPLPDYGYGPAETVNLDLSEDVLVKLQKQITTTGLSIARLMVIAAVLLLLKITRQNSVVVGVPYHDRGRADFQTLVGMCAYMLPISFERPQAGTALSAFESLNRDLETAISHAGFKNWSEIPGDLNQFKRRFHVIVNAMRADVRGEFAEFPMFAHWQPPAFFDGMALLIRLGEKSVSFHLTGVSSIYSKEELRQYLSLAEKLVSDIANSEDLAAFRVNELFGAESRPQ